MRLDDHFSIDNTLPPLTSTVGAVTTATAGVTWPHRNGFFIGGGLGWNLPMGDRRASSVRDYLVSRGVAAGRLEVRSFGEERPRHDNSREETRRLNRRAALVVRVQ